MSMIVLPNLPWYIRLHHLLFKLGRNLTWFCGLRNPWGRTLEFYPKNNCPLSYTHIRSDFQFKFWQREKEIGVYIGLHCTCSNHLIWFSLILSSIDVTLTFHEHAHLLSYLLMYCRSTILHSHFGYTIILATFSFWLTLIFR